MGKSTYESFFTVSKKELMALFPRAKATVSEIYSLYGDAIVEDNGVDDLYDQPVGDTVIGFDDLRFELDVGGEKILTENLARDLFGMGLKQLKDILNPYVEKNKDLEPNRYRMASNQAQEIAMNRQQLRPFVKQAMMNVAAAEDAFIEVSYHFPQVTRQKWASMTVLQKYALLRKTSGTSALAPMGLDKAAIDKGWGFMMYNIDEGENHSKFYEGLIVQDDTRGGFRVFVRWGALTDNINEDNTKGRQFDTDPRYFSESEMGAKRILSGIKSKRMSHGYKEVSTFKGGTGFYPVGLNRQAPFNWGNQQIAQCVPSLKRLEEQLQLAKNELMEQGQTTVLKDALETAFEVIRDVAPDSEMGKEIAKQIGNPLRRLTPIMQSRFKDPLNAKKLLASVNGMLRFLDAQLAHCR